jgi:flavin-dependent dehydrogenase
VDNIAFVFQELVEADGEFDENFYVFLREDISPTYAYLIPKNKHLKLGIGLPLPYIESSSQYITRFKNWLGDKFGYNEHSIRSKEVWGIPYGYVYVGRGNVLLSGDAAGFCNVFSGEGIRFAIRSGRSGTQSKRLWRIMEASLRTTRPRPNRSARSSREHIALPRV